MQGFVKRSRIVLVTVLLPGKEKIKTPYSAGRDTRDEETENRATRGRSGRECTDGRQFTVGVN